MNFTVSPLMKKTDKFKENFKSTEFKSPWREVSFDSECS